MLKPKIVIASSASHPNVRGRVEVCSIRGTLAYSTKVHVEAGPRLIGLPIILEDIPGQLSVNKDLKVPPTRRVFIGHTCRAVNKAAETRPGLPRSAVKPRVPFGSICSSTEDVEIVGYSPIGAWTACASTARATQTVPARPRAGCLVIGDFK